MARVAYGATSAADDDDDIRFGSMGYTTELSEDYVTTAQYMARDLDDPYAYEKKPIHYIPGYTGHLPLNRERFGVNYREASAATIAMQKSKGVHHPVTDLSAPAPNYVRATRTTRLPPAPHGARRPQRGWPLLAGSDAAAASVAVRALLARMPRPHRPTD
jgi:hypothetical protein